VSTLSTAPLASLSLLQLDVGGLDDFVVAAGVFDQVLGHLLGCLDWHPTSLWLTLEAAHKAERGEPYRMEAGMAKLVASEAGGRVVDRAMQIHGGYGMTKDLPFERWYREMRICRVGEGPNDVQRHVIARDLLGGWVAVVWVLSRECEASTCAIGAKQESDDEISLSRATEG
jgi:alkylation response protein AidB-like acyl-CoA dehydrogenase